MLFLIYRYKVSSQSRQAREAILSGFSPPYRYSEFFPSHSKETRYSVGYLLCFLLLYTVTYYFFSTDRQSYYGITVNFLGNQQMTSQRGQSQLTRPQASGIAVLQLVGVRQDRAASPPFKIAIDWQKPERPVDQPKGNSQTSSTSWQVRKASQSLVTLKWQVISRQEEPNQPASQQKRVSRADLLTPPLSFYHQPSYLSPRLRGHSRGFAATPKTRSSKYGNAKTNLVDLSAINLPPNITADLEDLRRNGLADKKKECCPSSTEKGS
jgi:hypothetical protein